MREIKFRGLDDQGKWHYGSYHYIQGDSSIRVSEWGSDGNRKIRQQDVTYDRHFILTPRLPSDIGWLITDTFSKNDVSSSSIGQYTGLLDNHGVDIYEGDIWEDSELRYVVEFGEYEFEGYMWFGLHTRLTSDPIGIGCPLCKEDSLVIQVIGNRFQNPELLQK
jgi:hypothetical protein